MNKKTILYLIAHIILCLSGLFAGVFGFAEMFGDVFTEIGQLPVHMAIPVFLSGIFTFTVVFQHGLDYETWEGLK